MIKTRTECLLRREFLKVTAYALTAPPLASLLPPQQEELLYSSAGEMARLIREKKISSHELVTACLQRIERVNGGLNAVVLLCAERALREAREADKALAAGRLRGPLHGVPMTVSDSFDASGVVSTGGTLGRRNFLPARDATAVARLRQAGAVLLGKTNVAELSLAPQADNLIYGRTANPYDTSRVPGGSDGGAAAVVASGGSPFDIGGDIEGGLRTPAHCCGLAAIKPTIGCVPRTGHIIGFGGLCDPYQQIGPMARRVDDLALILPVMAGMDYQDTAIVPMKLKDPGAVELESLRVAYYTGNGREPAPDAETVETIHAVARLLSSAGLQVKEDCPRDLMLAAEEIRAKYDGADDRAWVKRLLERHGTKSTHPGLPLAGRLVTAAEFTELAEQLDAQRSRLLQWLQNYDLVLCPVAAAPAQASRDELTSPPEYPRDYGYTGIFNLTGWPAAVVRAGSSSAGLPIGVQIAARPWREDAALAAARLVESQRGGWKPPAAGTAGSKRGAK